MFGNMTKFEALLIDVQSLKRQVEHERACRYELEGQLMRLMGYLGLEEVRQPSVVIRPSKPTPPP